MSDVRMVNGMGSRSSVWGGGDFRITFCQLKNHW